MKDIVRLIRFIGNAACRLDPEKGKDASALCRLRRPDENELVLSAATVEDAARRGLIQQRAGRIVTTPASRAFLRRFLAAREEAFLDQHRQIEIGSVADGDTVTPVRVNAAESPLSFLARLKDRTGAAWFPGDAICAGERLARDFHYAALQPRMTQSYEPRLGNRVMATPGAGVEMKDSVVAARLRVSGAVTAMGPELSGVALDVCCFEKGLETVERERQWPARSAKLMLKTALMQLHRHYNPVVEPARRSHAWGDEGFRPDLVP